MIDDISIQWAGFRKDSGRGAVWAWFTTAGSPIAPLWNPRQDIEEAMCYTISGRIGKTPLIESRYLTHAFLQSEVQPKIQNYRQVEPDKIVSRWGKEFNDELSMFVMMLKLKGLVYGENNVYRSKIVAF